jgi:hypothetical protein
VVYHLHPREILLHPKGIKLVLLSLRHEAVDGVLQLVLVVTATRSDGLPGDVSHIITDRCSKGSPLVPAEDSVPGEDLCDSLEFHLPWMRDSLDPISWGKGDSQVSKQSLKPAGGVQSFSPKGLHLLNVSI